MHSAMDRNYAPMTEVFLEVHQQTRRWAADDFSRLGFAATACFWTPLEECPNALNGGRRGDGSDYRPFSDVTMRR